MENPFFFLYLCGLGPQRVTVGFTIPVTQGYRIKVSHNAKQVSNRNPKLKKNVFYIQDIGNDDDLHYY